MWKYRDRRGCLDSLEATKGVLARVGDVEETVISNRQHGLFI